jgi:hypothetical protein
VTTLFVSALSILEELERMDAPHILLYVLMALGCIVGITTAATAIQRTNGRERSRSRAE